MIKKLMFAALLSAGMAGGAAAAVVTTFTDQTAYDAAVGTEVFFLNFDGPTSFGDTGVFPGLVDFNSPEASNPDLVNLNNAVGDNGSTTASNSVGPIEGVLVAPAFAMAMDISSGLISGIDLYDSTSALVESVVISATGFVGLSSDTAFSSFIVRNGVFPTGGNDRFFIDNFRVNDPASVPLPPAAVLLAVGLVLLGSLRRKAQE